MMKYTNSNIRFVGRGLAPARMKNPCRLKYTAGRNLYAVVSGIIKRTESVNKSIQ